jgi:preprotein translocase subunit SecA
MIDEACSSYFPPKGTIEEGAPQALSTWTKSVFAIEIPPSDLERSRPDDLPAGLRNRVAETYRQREAAFGAGQIRELERIVMLNVIDSLWKNHLYNMDRLKEGIGLAAYGQKDPLIEYKREGFGMFSAMLANVKHKTLEILFHVKAFSHHEEAKRPWAYEGKEERPAVAAIPRPAAARAEAPAFMPPGFPAGMPQNLPPATAPDAARAAPLRRETPKVGRNDPCPCGSGKKFKKCHGAASNN